VDFTPFLAQLRAEHALLGHHLAQRSLVFCLGSRLLVSALVRAASRPEAVLGAATTAAEGWSLVVRHRPDLLIVNDGLEQGCGVDLALRVKRHLPRTRVLLVLTMDSSQARLGEVSEQRAGLGPALDDVLVRLDRRSAGIVVLALARDAMGKLVWLPATGAEPVPPEEADAYVARQVGRDPDLWVLEVDDPRGRATLDTPSG